MRIGDRVNSDHHPVEVEIKEVARVKRKDCREKRWRGVWDEEECRRFREKVGEIKQRGGELAVGEEWERMKEKVRKAEGKQSRSWGGVAGEAGDGGMRNAG